MIRFATLEETRQQALRDVLDEIAAAYPEGASVFILGRYNPWLPTYGLPYPNEQRLLRREHGSLRLDFPTIHGAKGLEADVVGICDLVEGFRDLRGFPSSIENDPLLQLPLPHPDPFPDAEAYPAVTVRGAPTRCPRCQSGFLRWCKAGTDSFIGCSDHPACSHSRPAPEP